MLLVQAVNECSYIKCLERFMEKFLCRQNTVFFPKLIKTNVYFLKLPRQQFSKAFPMWWRGDVTLRVRISRKLIHAGYFPEVVINFFQSTIFVLETVYIQLEV